VVYTQADLFARLHSPFSQVLRDDFLRQRLTHTLILLQTFEFLIKGGVREI
jgi:hypothetical protein